MKIIEFPKQLSLKRYTLANIDSKIDAKREYISSQSLKEVVSDVSMLRNIADDMKTLADLYETRTIMQSHSLYKQYEEDDKPCDFYTYLETFEDDITRQG